VATLLSNGRIDLVVCDLEMPGRNGFDLVGAMRRAEGRVATLPVIALTGTIGPDAIERARTLGIADLVAKFDRSGLVAALSELDTTRLAAAA
jgi:two-component system chemotaxis sensor kinase CheA